jgi:predicted O-methyltransferase YrrM
MSAPDLRDASRQRADDRASWSAESDELRRAQRQILAATQELEGWLLDADTAKLVEIAYHCGDTILEVGTWAGRACVVELLGALARHDRRQRPQLVGVDISAEALDKTYRTLARHGLAHDAALYRGSLAELVREHDVAPSMVFLDGGHRYEEVREDLAILSGLLAPGVPVFGHDFTNAENDGGEFGVRRAFDEWEAHGDGELCGVFGCGALFVTSARCRGRAAVPLGLEAFEALRRSMRARHDVAQRLAGEGFCTVRADFAPQPIRFALGSGYGAESASYDGRALDIEWVRSPAVLLVDNPAEARRVRLRVALGSSGGPCDVALELNGEWVRPLFDVPGPLWEIEATHVEWLLTLRPGDNVARLLDDTPARHLPDGREASWQVVGAPVLEVA